MVKKIGNIAFWVIIVVLALIWSIDFILALTDKDPVFCLSKKEYTYSDGKVTRCIGLGYKVYHYKRDSLGKGVDITPLWGKMRSNK